MKKLFSALLLLVLAGSLLALKHKEEPLKTKLEKLSGTYVDATPYNYGKAWGKRVFTFDKGKWSLVFTLALDPNLQMPVFEFRTFGTYKLQEKSSTIADTYNAIFYEDRKFITVKTSDENLIQAFGFKPCAITPNVEKDISETGCSAWKSVAACAGDHDLLSLDKDGKLYFGERPADNDMCTPEKRPAKLTPPVIKIK